MTRTLRPALAVLLIASFALAFAGCGDDEGDDAAQTATAPTAETTETTTAPTGGGEVVKDATFVGRVPDSEAYIAIVTSPAGDKVAGYVCDGKTTSLWIGESPLTDGAGELLARKDGAQLGNVTVSQAGAFGKITIEGEEHAFTAAPAAAEAGLHHELEKKGTDVTAESGWVVLFDGSFRGVRTTSSGTTSAGKPTSGTSVDWIDPNTDPNNPSWINPNTDP